MASVTLNRYCILLT